MRVAPAPLLYQASYINIGRIPLFLTIYPKKNLFKKGARLS
ncbi:hypothetical protein CHCC20335_1364 [Bacillus paralicheniformis]|nr:hypothetical protein CHCC20335_1364 [Bacillus paralicheniformis]